MVNKLKKRILDIAYKNKLSHLGSYLSAVDIIDKIYSKKHKDDIFISNDSSFRKNRNR